MARPSPSEAPGNPRVLGLAFAAFSLGFGIWAMFAALGPFLIEWYDFSAGQVMFLAAVEPMGAMLLSIPLGAVTDRHGGRLVFTVLLLVLSVALLFGMFVESYPAFLLMGVVLGLGGASFVVGTAHVSVWYPSSRQGTALGILAVGNIGIVLGMVLVPLLVENMLGGPAGYAQLPPQLALGPIEGWHLIFLPFALASLLMALLYWVFTSEPPTRRRATSLREIVAVFTSGRLVWVVAYLYWVSFGTLTFFSASTPTYLADRWGVDAARASMLFTSVLVVCVAGMRPVGGWLSDHHDPLRLLTMLFGAALAAGVVMATEISLSASLLALYVMALTAGAGAAVVMKLIPTYFEHVGAVSGLAKAAGAACGFMMTSIMALSGELTGSYLPAFVIWAAMNALALYLVRARVAVPSPAVSSPVVPDSQTISTPERA